MEHQIQRKEGLPFSVLGSGRKQAWRVAKSCDAVGRGSNGEAGKEAPAGVDGGDGARTAENSSSSRDEEGIHVAGIRGITLENYQSNRGIKESTRGSNAASLKNHILPVLGPMEISDVCPTHISNFFRGLAEKHPSTTSSLNIYQLLHCMFEVAAEHDLVESNPVRRKLQRPQYRHKKMPIWSAENVQKILQEVPPRWKALFWCIALTAVRLGELLALQLKEIACDAKTITFGKSFWRGRLQDSTKTGQEHVRHMPESLERILAKHLEACKNIGADDFVFCRSEEHTSELQSRPHLACRLLLEKKKGGTPPGRLRAFTGPEASALVGCLCKLCSTTTGRFRSPGRLRSGGADRTDRRPGSGADP